VRSLGRFFRTDAVAGGELATAENDTELREQARTSVDGAWWWDGRRWVATSTPDGLWQWDGERWRPTIELRGVRPRDLATTLAFLAEDRYARAAAILVDRAREWQPEGEVRDLVGQALALRRGLHRLDGIVRGTASGSRGLFRRVRARPVERQRFEEEQALLDTRYRALLVRLGRRAARPSVKEADDLLDVASLMDERAARITQALVEGDEAERARANAIEAARAELHAAEAARATATEAAALALERARAERQRERRASRRRLVEAMGPDGAATLAEVGPLRAHPTSIETPAGRLPAEGACASVGPAVVLWREAREPLQDLLVLESPESCEFLRCLSERRRDQFLLLATRSRTLLWSCPPGEEKPVRQFAAAVNKQAGRAVEPAAARRAAAEAARVELTGGAAAAADQVAEAQAGLAAAEVDQRAIAAVEAAARDLQEARADPPALMAARRRVAAEVLAVSTPPPPLLAAAEREPHG
jgi:hypothetical protein